MKKKLPIIIVICTLVFFIIAAALLIGKEDDSSIKEPDATATQEAAATKTLAPSPTQTQQATDTPSPSPTVIKNTEIIATMTSTPYVFNEDNPDYREAMRSWVITIGDIARQKDSDFILIPQNSAPLFTISGEPGGELASDFLSVIDGIGVEGISFGNNRYNKSRKENDRNWLVELLNVGTHNGVNVLAVDYCDEADKIAQAIALSDQNGFLSFIADDMELRNIPDEILNINDNDVLTLDDAKNWLYLLNPERYSSRESFVDALCETDYDVLVIDAFFDTDEMLTYEDVQKLKIKSNGAKRLVISYMSIGEAEDYRFYWKDEYDNNPPSWMLWENSEWEGNYPVEYWNSEWQDIIAFGEDSYLNRILSAGFDGVYLDIVDGYETFEDMQ